MSLLALDDFLISPPPVEACRDLLDVVGDRAERRATAVASELPDKGHAAMADPTLTVAVSDRPCVASRRIAMKARPNARRQPTPNSKESQQHPEPSNRPAP